MPLGAAGGASALAHLREYLFAEAAPAGPAEPGEAVFFSAPGEGREAVEIARRIIEEARDGTPFDRMAILLRAPVAYSSLSRPRSIARAFPAFFARGARRPDPAGRALLLLLDCALEKLSARRFAEYLSLGQVPPLDAGGAPPTRAPGLGRGGRRGARALGRTMSPSDGQTRAGRRAGSDGARDADLDGTGAADSAESPVLEGSLRAPWKWERLLVDSAVIGGRERWSRRLTGLAAELRLRLDELRAEEPDSPRLALIERDLANLEHLERFALPVIERLAALPAQATWGEWIAQLEALAPMALRRPERVLGVLAELRALGPIGPVALDEVRDVLAEGLATVAERPPAARYGRVFVGTLEQARGRAFDVVFVPGLAERIFPQKPREDPILLDALRAGAGRRAGDAGRPRPARAPAAAPRRRRGHAARVSVVLAHRAGGGAAARAVVLRHGGARALEGRIPDPQTLAREAAAVAGRAWRGPRRMIRRAPSTRSSTTSRAWGPSCASSRARRGAARAICSS